MTGFYLRDFKRVSICTVSKNAGISLEKEDNHYLANNPASFYRKWENRFVVKWVKEVKVS